MKDNQKPKGRVRGRGQVLNPETDPATVSKPTQPRGTGYISGSAPSAIRYTKSDVQVWIPGRNTALNLTQSDPELLTQGAKLKAEKGNKNLLLNKIFFAKTKLVSPNSTKTTEQQERINKLEQAKKNHYLKYPKRRINITAAKGYKKSKNLEQQERINKLAEVERKHEKKYPTKLKRNFRPLLISSSAGDLKIIRQNSQPTSLPPFWKTAFTYCAYAALFGASIWGVPDAAKNFASMAIKAGYVEISQHFSSTVGRGMLYTNPFIACAHIYFASSSGVMLLSITTCISSISSCQEGNVYPGLLGIAGTLLYALSRDIVESGRAVGK